ncbi:hypothetical protein [Nocardia fluminea]|uniref:hypothetical protein n=1 Tax=Nocardia fluminea TaxID=134984 RepID=UPI003648307D
MRKTGPSAPAVAIVRRRSGTVCEVCGARRANQIHHRRPRGAGGTRRPETNSPSALLDLCNECHALIESRREWARDHGYLVRQHLDPATTPVWLWGRWVLLADDGQYLEHLETA